MIFMNVCYNGGHGNSVKEIRGLWDNIHDCVCVVILVAMVVLKEFGRYDKIYDCV
jgi:hypothetical protein